MFIQPNWFKVMQPSVGTNTFSYSSNGPVNKFDPNGNQTLRAVEWQYDEYSDTINRAVAEGAGSDVLTDLIERHPVTLS